MNNLVFSKDGANELEGFWNEIRETAPKTWQIVCLIGFTVVGLGASTDFHTFKDSNLPLALLLRSIFFFYFLINFLITFKFHDFVKRNYQILMALMVYLVGIPIGLMSALGGEDANLYFMAIIEIEFAAATFVTISKKKLLPGIAFINIFYILSNLAWGEQSFSSKLTTIGVSLIIFAVLAFYAHHTILEYKIRNYLRRQELIESEKKITTILSRITDAFFALDNEWRFTYFNREAEHLLSKMKRTKENLIGKSLWDEFPGLSDSFMKREFILSVEKNVPVTFEEYYPLMDAYMEVHGYPSSEGLSVYLNDISHRKLAEESFKKSHEELELRVLERTAELQKLTTFLDTIREEEWKRISREIHDELGQILTGLNMDISWLKTHLQETDEATVGRLKIMADNVKEMVEGVRRIAAELRPIALDDLGLAAAVEWYVYKMKERTGVQFNCMIDPEEIVVDSDRAIAIFRILQEAINNAIRHGRATQIMVILRQVEDRILLEVKDNGIGLPDPSERRQEGGLGLIGMKERVRRFDGRFSINGNPGEGTTIHVLIPYLMLPTGSQS